MSERRSPETEYARRLRAELTTIVAERGAERAAHTSRSAPSGKPVWHRRGPRLGLAGAAVAVIAIVALIVGASGGDTPAAFAVEAQPDGYVGVEIRSLEDASGLEDALSEAGIPASVTYLQSGMVCKEPRFQPAPGPKDARVIVTGSGNSGPIVFHVGTEAVGSGLTLVITASPSTYATLDTFQAEIAEGTVAPCDPVPAP
jgi:hypothetical protein